MEHRLFNLRFLRGRRSRAVVPDAGVDPVTVALPRDFRVMADSPVASLSPGAPLAVRAPTPIGLAEGEMLLRDVFTPTQPRSLGPLFIGRERYLRRLVAAVEEERAHIVLFGDRGRGKTSLANAFAHLTAEAGYVVLRCSCGSSTSFEALFRSLLAELPPHLLGPGDQLPDGDFGATGLTESLRRLRGGHVILLIDEFDRVQSDALRVDLAEAIKNLSDARAPVTFFIVGVAQSLDDLLGRHPSIQRNIVGLHLAPMQAAEIRRMILAGAAAARISFQEPVIGAVLGFARGMPYYAHLLCLFAARAASVRGSAEVAMEDLVLAVDDVLMKQEPELGRGYIQVTAGTPVVEDVLFAAAMAEADPQGRVTAAALGDVMLDPDRRMRLRPAVIEEALASLTESGTLLRQGGADAALYTFAQPGLAHYTLFRQAARRGLLALQPMVAND